MSRWVSTSVTSTPPTSGGTEKTQKDSATVAARTDNMHTTTLDDCTTRLLGRGRWLELREIQYEMPTEIEKPNEVGKADVTPPERKKKEKGSNIGKWEFVRRTTSHQRADVPRDEAACTLPDAVEMIVTVRVTRGQKGATTTTASSASSTSITTTDGPKAVGDEAEYLLVVRQYRPPLDAFCIEFPAGLVDADDADAAVAARRELAEEAGVRLGPTRQDPGVVVQRIDVIDTSPVVAYEPGMSASTCAIVRVRVDVTVADDDDDDEAANDASSSEVQQPPRWLRALCAQRELEDTELELEVLALRLGQSGRSSGGSGTAAKPSLLLDQLQGIRQQAPSGGRGGRSHASAATPPTRVDAKLWAYALSRAQI